MDLTNVIELRKLVEEVLVEEETPIRAYARYKIAAIRGLTELHLLHLDKHKEAWLPVSTIETVTLPDDFVRFEAIGVPIHGRLWTFTKDDKIITPTGLIGGSEALNSDRGEGVEKEVNFDPGYTTGGGYNTNYYKIDLDNNRIILQGTDRTEVLLYYLSSGVSIDTATYVPLQAVKALKKIIQHTISSNKLTNSQNLRHDMAVFQVREREVSQAINDLRYLENMFTPDQYLDMRFENTYGGIKS